MRKHFCLKQLPFDKKKPNVINIELHLDAIAWTDFDNFEDSMNPWNIWLQRLNKAKEDDLKLVNSEEYKNTEKYFMYDEMYYHQNIHNPQYAAFISAIFVKVENHLKMLLHSKECKFEKLIKEIEDKGIKGEDLKKIDKVNILRLYNNAYKHNSMCMTNVLAKALNIKYKGCIDYTSLNVLAFIKNCYEFLWDVEEKLRKINSKTVGIRK